MFVFIRSIILFILIGCWISLSPAIAHADDRKVRFATMELAPYGFLDESGNITGYLYEIANLIIGTAELPIINGLFPVERMIKEITDGRRDCTIAVDAPIIIKIFQLIEKIGKKIKSGILPRKGITISNYHDLYNHVIAVPHGTSFTLKFDKDDEIKRQFTNGYRHSINMMVRGRVDAIAGAIDSLRYSARKNQLVPNDIFGEAFIFTTSELWLVCAKDQLSPKMKEHLKQTVIQLRDSGEFQIIIDKYL